MEKRYDTILWDVDGTLLNFLESEKYAIYETFRHFDIQIDEEIRMAYSAINDSYWKRLEKKEVKKIDVLRGRFLTLFQELSPQGNLCHKKIDQTVLENIDVDEFRALYQKNLGSVYYYQDDSLQVCESLKQKGYHQFIITNGVTCTQQNKLTLAGFYDVMDDIFISEQIGVDKPDNRFFEGCFQRMEEKGFHTDIKRMIVIGDSLTSDMQGARNAGIDNCLYLGPVKENHQKMMEKTADKLVDYILYDLRKVEEILCPSHPIRN